MTRREMTFSSPFLHATEPEYHAANNVNQHDLLRNSFTLYLGDPFEKGVDLRGKKFEVVMHDDGLHVTVREV